MGLNPTDSIWSSAYHQDLLSKAQINAMNEHYKQTINMTLEALAPKMTYFCMILERDPVRHHPRAESNMGKDAEFKTLGATRLNICKLLEESIELILGTGLVEAKNLEPLDPQPLCIYRNFTP